jgi:hypothetical protein
MPAQHQLPMLVRLSGGSPDARGGNCAAVQVDFDLGCTAAPMRSGASWWFNTATKSGNRDHSLDMVQTVHISHSSHSCTG